MKYIIIPLYLSKKKQFTFSKNVLLEPLPPNKWLWLERAQIVGKH